MAEVAARELSLERKRVVTRLNSMTSGQQAVRSELQARLSGRVPMGGYR